METKNKPPNQKKSEIHTSDLWVWSGRLQKGHDPKGTLSSKNENSRTRPIFQMQNKHQEKHNIQHKTKQPPIFSLNVHC